MSQAIASYRKGSLAYRICRDESAENPLKSGRIRGTFAFRERDLGHHIWDGQEPQGARAVLPLWTHWRRESLCRVPATGHDPGSPIHRIWNQPPEGIAWAPGNNAYFIGKSREEALRALGEETRACANWLESRIYSWISYRVETCSLGKEHWIPEETRHGIYDLKKLEHDLGINRANGWEPIT